MVAVANMWMVERVASTRMGLFIKPFVRHAVAVKFTQQRLVPTLPLMAVLIAIWVP